MYFTKEEVRRQMMLVTTALDKVIGDAVTKHNIHPFIVHVALLTQAAASRGATRQSYGLAVTEKIEKMVAHVEDICDIINPKG